ncbi:oligosaccharyl transferase, archaeosortase A system-associated [Halobaculum sp. D14]|uniref:oligosaccharyl transferase, archaeosortase A system-associated n=1 Tax=Halobaculum sp. D14 TaxID=3421642 RepID=UPI003EB94440
MSNGSDSDASASGVRSILGLDYDFEGKSVADLLQDFYQVPALLVVVAVMLWIRLQSYSRFVQNGEVYFSGNDAWYHLREIRYTVQHWPSTMPFDPWTGFPYGHSSGGQFGSLYDQLIATAAIVLGAGDPSAELVAKTLLVAPAVFGALTAIPTYLIGKRLGGRLGGLFSAAILMLLPGTFLRRGLVGFADHNIAEPLFQAFAVVAILVALAVAQRDRPIWELVEAGERDELRPTAVWSAVAGVATGLYLWVWPPGILLLGIFAVFLAYQAVSDFAGGRSPDHVAFVGVITMVVTALMALVGMEDLALTPVTLSPLHVGFALAVAAGSVFLAWLAREFESREFDDELLDRYGYAGTVGGLLAVASLAVFTVDISIFNTIANNLLRFIGFSAGAATRTIGEAQPFLESSLARYYSAVGIVLSEYGFTFFTAFAAAVWVLVKPMWQRGRTADYYYLAASGVVVALLTVGSELFVEITAVFGVDPQLAGLGLVAALIFGAAARVRYDAELLFAVIWAAFITSAAFTQVRFNYYLAVSVAAFNAYFLREVLRIAGVELSTDISTPDVELYQALVVAAAVMVVLVPVLTVPLTIANTGNPNIDKTNTAVQVGNSTSPGAVTIWDESLEWMQGNTPAVGNYGGAGNADKLDYYGTYKEPADGDYDYAEGAYGVMSWWDYGHWITVEGHRIPNANPFQQGATAAANYLLAPNASQAQDVLQRQSTEGNQTRYVMVDWKMTTVGSKFGAPVIFYSASNVSSSDFYSPVLQRGQSGYSVGTYSYEQRYYQSMMVRLYEGHGSRMEPTVNAGMFGEFVVVFDYDTVQGTQGNTYKVLPQGQNATAIRTFRNMSAAEAFVEQEGSAQIGGVGPYPREAVPALKHYRLVKASNTSAYASGQYQQSVLQESRAYGLRPSLLQKTSPQWVKTFERVPGATVEGSGAQPNETLTASVQMRVPGSNSTFTYTQQTTADADGDFQFTLPYSTTGYANYGPDNGYTNVSVRATGPYTIAGEIRTNESAYVVRNQATLNVSEGRVVGDVDGAKTVTLDTRVLQSPGGANQTDDNSSTGNATNSSALVPPTLDVDGNDALTASASASADAASAGSASPALLAAERELARP